MLGHHAEVSRQRKLQPAPERVSVDDGDHGLPEPRETLEGGVSEGRPRAPHLDRAQVCEAPDVGSDTEDTLGKPEEPVQVIHLVDLRKEGPAAQLSLRTVGLAIVLVAVPVGQVLTHLRPDRHDPADRLLLQQFANPQNARMEAPLVPDEGD